MHHTIGNKCIRDDTKAAARHSLNCIKNKTNKIWRKTIFNMADGILTPCNVAWPWQSFRQVTAPCNVACCSGIVTMNSPSGSNLQCDTWLWDDMPLNSPKRPPYWNSTSGFDFDHITAVDIPHQSPKFYRNWTTLGRKNDVMSSFKIADFRGPIMGSLKSPGTTFYRSSIDTIALNCLVFEKIVFFAFWRQTDRWTDGQHRRIKPLSLLRAAT